MQPEIVAQPIRRIPPGWAPAASGHAAEEGNELAPSHELSSKKADNLAHHLTAEALCFAAKYSCLCRFRVTTGKPQNEHMFSGLPSTADIGEHDWYVSVGPGNEHMHRNKSHPH